MYNKGLYFFYFISVMRWVPIRSKCYGRLLHGLHHRKMYPTTMKNTWKCKLPSVTSRSLFLRRNVRKRKYATLGSRDLYYLRSDRSCKCAFVFYFFHYYYFIFQSLSTDLDEGPPLEWTIDLPLFDNDAYRIKPSSKRQPTNELIGI